MDNNLPNAYRCAIECLDNGERTEPRFLGLMDHFEKAYGLHSQECKSLVIQWRKDARDIAIRKYCLNW